MSSYITPGGGGGPSIQTERISADQVLEVNKRYILTGGSSPLTLTLPTAASVGDVIVVDAEASVEWIIAQNEGQRIICNGDISADGEGNGIESGAVRNSITLTCSTTDTNFVAEAQIGTAVIYTAPVPPDPSNVSHFLLNDNAANANVADALGNNPLVLNGADTADLSVVGKINDALSFTGSEWAQTADPTTVDFSVSKSIACWVKPSAAGVAKTAMMIGNPPGQFILLYVNTDGSGECQFYWSGFTGGSGITGTLTLDAWNHLVGVIDAPNGMAYFYVNGVLAGDFDFGEAQSGTESGGRTSIFLGAQGEGDNALIGDLDDARIYNSVLTQDDVDFLYNSGNGTEDEIPPTPDYRLKSDGFNGTQWIDEIQGAAWDNFGAVLNGGYVEFDGTAYLLGPTFNFLSPNITVNVWIKPTNQNGGSPIVVDCTSGGNDSGIMLNTSYVDDAGIYCVAGNPGDPLFAYGEQNLTLNDWVMLTGVINPSNEVTKFYINGVPVFTNPNDGSQSGSSVGNVNPVTIGGNSDLVTLNQFFIGLIDEVSFWVTAISDEEVLAYYNATQGAYP